VRTTISPARPRGETAKRNVQLHRDGAALASKVGNRESELSFASASPNRSRLWASGTKGWRIQFRAGVRMLDSAVLLADERYAEALDAADEAVRLRGRDLNPRRTQRGPKPFSGPTTFRSTVRRSAAE
jgi:hypothetical protein